MAFIKEKKYFLLMIVAIVLYVVGEINSFKIPYSDNNWTTLSMNITLIFVGLYCYNRRLAWLAGIMLIVPGEITSLLGIVLLYHAIAKNSKDKVVVFVGALNLLVAIIAFVSVSGSVNNLIAGGRWMMVVPILLMIVCIIGVSIEGLLSREIDSAIIKTKIKKYVVCAIVTIVLTAMALLIIVIAYNSDSSSSSDRPWEKLGVSEREYKSIYQDVSKKSR